MPASAMSSSTEPVKIACIGEAMIELSMSNANKSEAKVGFAGDTLNTAIYLRRYLPNEHSVSYISALGIDSFSDRLCQFISNEEILTDNITRLPNKLPGLYAIQTDSLGERSFSYWRNDSAAKRLFQNKGEIDFSVLEEFDVLYLSAITLAILPMAVRNDFFVWLKTYRLQSTRKVIFDSNYRPQLWNSPAEARTCIEMMWKHTDIALPSIDDEMLVFNDDSEEALIERFSHYNIGCGVLKRGSQGPRPMTNLSTELNFSPATSIVDSTAAGDSFNGAFLASYLTGHTIEESMLAGHQCASTVIGYAGAIMPREAM